MWQSLGFGPNYKAAYCQAVCPAGDDIIGPYVADKAGWRRDVVVPLLRKEENVYVTSGSRAERVARRNPSKRVRYVDYEPRLSTPGNFLLGLQHRFDRTLAAGVSVRVELRFADRAVLVTVEDGLLMVDELETAPDPSAAAVVELLGNAYIRLLHPESPRPAAGFPRSGPAATARAVRRSWSRSRPGTARARSPHSSRTGRSARPERRPAPAPCLPPAPSAPSRGAWCRGTRPGRR